MQIQILFHNILGNNGTFLSSADVYLSSFFHTSNCLERNCRIDFTPSKLADNFNLGHLAIGNKILHSDLALGEPTRKTVKDYLSMQKAPITEISNC